MRESGNEGEKASETGGAFTDTGERQHEMDGQAGEQEKIYDDIFPPIGVGGAVHCFPTSLQFLELQGWEMARRNGQQDDTLASHFYLFPGPCTVYKA